MPQNNLLPLLNEGLLNTYFYKLQNWNTDIKGEIHQYNQPSNIASNNKDQEHVPEATPFFTP